MRLIPIAGFCGAGKSLATLRLALQMQQNGESVCICLDRENPITRALVEEYKIKAFTGKPEEIQGYENVICECYGLDTGNKAKLMATGCQVAPMTVVVDPARLHMMAAYGAAGRITISLQPSSRRPISFCCRTRIWTRRLTRSRR